MDIIPSMQTSPALERHDEQFSTEFSFSKEEAEFFKKELPNSISTPQSDVTSPYHLKLYLILDGVLQNIGKKLNAVITSLGRSILDPSQKEVICNGTVT